MTQNEQTQHAPQSPNARIMRKISEVIGRGLRIDPDRLITGVDDPEMELPRQLGLYMSFLVARNVPWSELGQFWGVENGTHVRLSVYQTGRMLRKDGSLKYNYDKLEQMVRDELKTEQSAAKRAGKKEITTPVPAAPDAPAMDGEPSAPVMPAPPAPAPEPTPPVTETFSAAKNGTNRTAPEPHRSVLSDANRGRIARIAKLVGRFHDDMTLQQVCLTELSARGRNVSVTAKMEVVLISTQLGYTTEEVADFLGTDDVKPLTQALNDFAARMRYNSGIGVLIDEHRERAVEAGLSKPAPPPDPKPYRL